jgi:hypothetical protein
LAAPGTAHGQEKVWRENNNRANRTIFFAVTVNSDRAKNVLARRLCHFNQPFLNFHSKIERILDEVGKFSRISSPLTVRKSDNALVSQIDVLGTLILPQRTSAVEDPVIII